MAKATKAEMQVDCPKCHSLLMNIVSGAVCPKGCGGIWPKVDAEHQSQAVRMIRVESLPAATRLESIQARASGDEWADKRLYLVKHEGDVTGLMRRVARVGSSLSPKKQPEGVVLAYDRINDQVVALKPSADSRVEITAILAGIAPGDAPATDAVADASDHGDSENDAAERDAVCQP
jgi:hypothetical protein